MRTIPPSAFRAVRVAAAVGAASFAASGCIIQKGAVASAGSSPSAAEAAAGPPLRQAGAAAHRRVGTALMSHKLGSERVRTFVAAQFDSLTPENEMKWYATEPRPGEFSFAAGDRLLEFAEASHMRLRGHTLVWHSQLAPWVKGLPGPELREAMARHVRGLVGHWKGRVAAWDVVNEAFADGPSGELRPDSPFTTLGPTFIDDAFRLAREADPAAQLFYNDYEIEAGEGNAKSDAAYALCKRLKEAGVPIDGIGMQMHVDPRHWPSPEAMRANFERFAALGLVVELTELDLPVGEIPGTLAEKLEQQRVLAHDVVAACVAVPKCAAITFWGVIDPDSWLSSAEWAPLRGTGPHYPLLFDSDYRAKPAVAGVLDALAGR